MTAAPIPPRTNLPPGHPDEFLGLAMAPVEQIRIMLMRRKGTGVVYDWDRLFTWAVARVRWPHDHEERHTEKTVVAWSEPYFRAAYEDRAETPAVLGLLELLSLLAKQEPQ